MFWVAYEPKRTEKTNSDAFVGCANAAAEQAQQCWGVLYGGLRGECAVKACIAKEQGLYPFPPRLTDKELRNYYTHDVEVLIVTAKLKAALDADCSTNTALQDNWATVVAWSEQSRYDVAVSRTLAAGLIKAIEDPRDGVLTWLMNHW